MVLVLSIFPGRWFANDRIYFACQPLGSASEPVKASSRTVDLPHWPLAEVAQRSRDHRNVRASVGRSWVLLAILASEYPKLSVRAIQARARTQSRYEAEIPHALAQFLRRDQGQFEVARCPDVGFADKRKLHIRGKNTDDGVRRAVQRWSARRC